MSRIHFYCKLKFQEQISISKGVISINSMQFSLRNMFMVDELILAETEI